MSKQVINFIILRSEGGLLSFNNVNSSELFFGEKMWNPKNKHRKLPSSALFATSSKGIIIKAKMCML